jgi:hypothetical protein
MDVDGMLKTLKDECEMVNVAIAALERLQVGAPKRRGRPPLWLTQRRKETNAAMPPAPTAASGEEAGVVAKKRRGRPPKVRPEAT